MKKLLLRGGRIIDPASGKDEVRDVLIDGARISAIDSRVDAKGVTAIDCSGKVVAPGFVDLHVHLREPGQEQKETIATGTRAAAAGGFTSVVCMPNTDPIADEGAVIEFMLKRAAAEGSAHVYPAGALSKRLLGEEIAEMAEMIAAGARAFTDDGEGTANAEVMRRAMEYARMYDVPILAHCEDRRLSRDGAANEGYNCTVLGLPPHPKIAEEVMVARNCLLAKLTGARLHIQHVSSGDSVAIIRGAKQMGVRVTSEATPHHFTLTDNALETYDTNLKMNPPLRTHDDIEALKEGLADGTIDAVATDHSPHAQEEKEVEFIYAPFGIIGLETTLPLTLAGLVAPGVLSLSEAIAKLALIPARILGIDAGELRVGGPADVTVIDLDAGYTYTAESVVSMSKNSPFLGRTFRGRPILTICAGRITHQA